MSRLGSVGVHLRHLQCGHHQGLVTRWLEANAKGTEIQQVERERVQAEALSLVDESSERALRRKLEAAAHQSWRAAGDHMTQLAGDEIQMPDVHGGVVLHDGTIDVARDLEELRGIIPSGQHFHGGSAHTDLDDLRAWLRCRYISCFACRPAEKGALLVCAQAPGGQVGEESWKEEDNRSHNVNVQACAFGDSGRRVKGEAETSQIGVCWQRLASPFARVAGLQAHVHAPDTGDLDVCAHVCRQAGVLYCAVDQLDARQRRLWSEGQVESEGASPHEGDEDVVGRWCLDSSRRSPLH
mmetsp:Transcript_157986/g.506716  ORF Transcript_157986/g.506716 Transcript_157986/m.506716 type:complete len:297 (+) Transcript_157986:1165-2055(+)